MRHLVLGTAGHIDHGKSALVLSLTGVDPDLGESGSSFDLKRFREEPVLGILRGVTEESLAGVLEAMIAGGLRFAEVTLNTPNAAALIAKASKRYSNSICLGAGTVTNWANTLPEALGALGGKTAETG